MNDIKYNRSDIVLIIYILAMSTQYILEYRMYEGNIISVYLFRIIVLYGFLVPVLYMIFEYLPKLNFYRILFIVVFVLNVSVTIIYIIEGDVKYYSNILIYYGMLIGYFISINNLEIIERAFKILAIFGILLFPYLLLTNDFNISDAIARRYTWTSTFFYAGFYWAYIPFAIISFIKNRNKVLSVLYWICGLTINLLFMKRAVVVDSILLILALFYILAKKRKIVRSFPIIILFLVIIVVYVIPNFENVIYEITEAIKLRFLTTANDISSFDRLIETKNYFNKSSIFDVILGEGFIGTHDAFRKGAVALHIGWANLIFKGGIFLVIVVLIPLLNILIISKDKLYEKDKLMFSIIILIIYALRMFYLNFHSFMPEIPLMFYAMFVIMDNKKI